MLIVNKIKIVMIANIMMMMRTHSDILVTRAHSPCFVHQNMLTFKIMLAQRW